MFHHLILVHDLFLLIILTSLSIYFSSSKGNKREREIQRSPTPPDLFPSSPRWPKAQPPHPYLTLARPSLDPHLSLRSPPAPPPSHRPRSPSPTQTSLSAVPTPTPPPASPRAPLLLTCNDLSRSSCNFLLRFPLLLLPASELLPLRLFRSHDQ